MTRYFGFAFSPAMLQLPANVRFEEIPLHSSKKDVEAAVSCINPSHTATIQALKSRFGISPEIPETAPRVSLCAGDSLLILQVFGLPRLGGDRKEYTPEEIAGASFKLLLASVSYA